MRLVYGLTKEQKQYIEQRYNEGIGSTTIAKELGISNGRVSYHISRHMTARSFTEMGKRYKCNETFFENINTEHKAYWLGFMYADGYVSTAGKYNHGTVGLSISTNDIEHLEKFKHALQFDGPIRTYKVGSAGYKPDVSYSRILISSEKLYNDIVAQGVVEHKTNVAVFPKILACPFNPLKRDFIRGYIDGDGCIAISHHGSRLDFSIKVLGTEQMLKNIRLFFLNNGLKTRDKFYKRKPNQTVLCYEIAGNKRVRYALDLLYKGSTIYLDRKYERYIELCNRQQSCIAKRQCLKSFE